MYKCPKKKFTPEEDAMLLKLVKQIGACKWDTIALSMPGRKGRQCRDRYMNYLNLNVNHDEWTAEEDALLSKKVSEYGTRWSKISKFFDGRTGPALKNRWNYRISRKRTLSQNQSDDASRHMSDDTALQSPEEIESIDDSNHESNAIAVSISDGDTIKLDNLGISINDSFSYLLGHNDICNAFTMIDNVKLCDKSESSKTSTDSSDSDISESGSTFVSAKCPSLSSSSAATSSSEAESDEQDIKNDSNIIEVVFCDVLTDDELAYIFAEENFVFLKNSFNFIR